MWPVYPRSRSTRHCSLELWYLPPRGELHADFKENVSQKEEDLNPTLAYPESDLVGIIYGALPEDMGVFPSTNIDHCKSVSYKTTSMRAGSPLFFVIASWKSSPTTKN